MSLRVANHVTWDKPVKKLIIPIFVCCLVPLGRPILYRVKGKEDMLFLRREAYFPKAGISFCLSTIDGSTIHHHFHNLDVFRIERKIFSTENTHGKLLTTDQGSFRAMNFTIAFTTCSWWVFGPHLESNPVP